MKEVYGVDDLKKQIWLNQDKGIVIVGDAGTGKTVTVMDAVVEMGITPILYRMQGIDSTDINGIPTRNEQEHCLEYLKPKEIHKIMSNPNQKYALILDEVNRAEPEMAPILFQLFEKKIENKTYENLIVIAMINVGQDYDTNIDFSSDKALLRRVAMMRFKPNTDDVLRYAKEKNYNTTIQKVLAKLDGNYWSYSSKSQSEEDIENVTTLGSFYDWNNYLIRLAQLKGVDHNSFDISEIITTWVKDVSNLFFNTEIGGKVYSILITLKNLCELDIQKDIIDKETIPDQYKKYKEEILIRVTQHFIEKAKNKDYVTKNARHIINLFKDRKEFVIKIIKDTSDIHGTEITLKFLEEFDENTENDYIQAINAMSTM